MGTFPTSRVTRDQKIDFIQSRRHGALGTTRGRALLELAVRPGQRGRMVTTPTPEILADEQALQALPDAELDAQYEAVKAVEVRRLVAEEEAKLFFNHSYANADYGHWAKCAYWSVFEGAALLLGKDPKVVNWESLRPYSTFAFVHGYDRIVDLATRAIAWNQLTKPCGPGAFLAWAKRYDLGVPPELEAAVAKYGHFVGDWKTLYDGVKVQLDQAKANEREAVRLALQLKDQIAALGPQIAAATAVQQSQAKPVKGADLRELESLRKLVVGMAIKGYGHDPAKPKSDKIAEIVSDLEQLGLPLHRDTVRKYLKEAASLLPAEAVGPRDE